MVADEHQQGIGSPGVPQNNGPIVLHGTLVANAQPNDEMSSSSIHLKSPPQRVEDQGEHIKKMV
jgi:hypothetical protein